MLNNIEILSRVIIEDAYREANLIIEHAQKEASEIERSALFKVSNLKKSAKNTLAHTAFANKKGKIVSLSEFRSRCEILSYKEKFINKILLKVQNEFFSMAKGKEYQALLKRLILEAVKLMTDEARDFVCQINVRDRKLLESGMLDEIKKETNKNISIDENSIPIAGGAVIYTADFRVLYDNSFEAIFERAKEMMRYIAAEALFGED